MWWLLLSCCLSLIQNGWSASEYVFKSYHHETSSIHQHHSEQISVGPSTYEQKYFFFTAPQDKRKEMEAFRSLLSPAKQQPQVIFIRTPLNDVYERVLQNLIQSTQQHKTHIYIFSRDQDPVGLEQSFQKLRQTHQNHPDVHFITYRNALDAERIQSSIIAQYGGRNERNILRPRSLPSNNSPVSKTYAMNFLPKGVDVVPGSSYIPLSVL